MAALALECPFILMTSDKTAVDASLNQFGGTQAIKTGLG